MAEAALAARSTALTRVAEDLRTLAWLNAAERDPATWLALHGAGFPAGLVVLPKDDPAMQRLSAALTELRVRFDADAASCSDELAADFADIYLTNGLHASPYESVWLDEDHLMMQGPTFAVRQEYKKHGMTAPDWRAMPDDHLSHELSFVAHLIDKGAVEEASGFLDRHVLRWLPQFGDKVAERAATPVYAALAVLTAQACVRIRGQWLDPARSTDELS